MYTTCIQENSRSKNKSTANSFTMNKSFEQLCEEAQIKKGEEYQCLACYLGEAYAEDYTRDKELRKIHPFLKARRILKEEHEIMMQKLREKALQYKSALSKLTEKDLDLIEQVEAVRPLD